jgi:hypothetical protein
MIAKPLNGVARNRDRMVGTGRFQGVAPIADKFTQYGKSLVTSCGRRLPAEHYPIATN